ncbi:MAG: hypothetical protein WCQ60_02350 [bacterium]
MTLIELLIYTVFVTIILTGSVFSAYSILFAGERAQAVTQTFTIY